ncbi:MAG: DUF1499 domain-containing protein [Dokdonella sp.]|nr:DUF1499 domain-containing protein [Dokdonella sp.]MCB1574421.1 DUF1499 domain-containing protein [Xanthomonadales bacterium]MCB1577788.1 DUF1499 domain-containing protein [Xanthomonadales bacterium]
MKLSRIPVLLAILALVLLIASGPGSRFGWWEFRTGFSMMRWTVYLGLGAGVLALLFLVIPRTRRGNAGTLALGLVLGLAASALPLYGLSQAKSLPMIHDITTDTKRPPEFVAVLPLRANAANPAEYGGPEIAAKQSEAYPDIRTQHLDAAPADAFNKVEQIAHDMGWEIVSADAAAGRLEATDTTFWYGFKDDIVVRVEPEAAGSRIDVRSVSRVGLSDVGKNAKRIRAFIKALGSQPAAD